MYTTIDEAQEALRMAEQDVIADFGEEGLEAGWHDVVRNVAGDCTDEVARDLLRMELGLGIFPGDPDPLAPYEPLPYIQDRIDSEFEKRVAARVAENRRKARLYR